MLGLLLSGCGGDSGVTSTPAPTYTKLEDLSGNQTFQSAGIHYSVANGETLGPSIQQYSDGVVIEYTASTDSFTVTAPDNTSLEFGATTGSPPPLFFPQPDTTTFFNGSDSFSIQVPTVNGVALSYMTTGDWSHIENGVSSIYLSIFGVPTTADDMPRNGTATYQTSINGSALDNFSTFYTLGANSTATFSANFGTGTVSTTLNLIGITTVNPTPVDFGSYTGSGVIASGTPGFSGTLAPAAGNALSLTGEFSGAFFGPQAAEMGYAWYLGSGTGRSSFGAQGITTGSK